MKLTIVRNTLLLFIGLCLASPQTSFAKRPFADPDSTNGHVFELDEATKNIFLKRYKWEFAGTENESLFDFVAEWHGTPYWYGGTSRRGVDCAAFVQNLYNSVFQIEIPRDGHSQAMVCDPVKKEDLQEGDLVFFRYGSTYIGHVGVYLGHGRFAHSASRVGVIVSYLEEPFWKRFFATGGRVKADHKLVKVHN
jgi:murein DD-endopeptidase / murein LD-carboxypeptidase